MFQLSIICYIWISYIYFIYQIYCSENLSLVEIWQPRSHIIWLKRQEENKSNDNAGLLQIITKRDTLTLATGHHEEELIAWLS